MEDSIRKKTIADILAKVFTGYWRCFFEKFDDDVAVIGHDGYHCRFLMLNEGAIIGQGGLLQHRRGDSRLAGQIVASRYIRPALGYKNFTDRDMLSVSMLH